MANKPTQRQRASMRRRTQDIRKTVQQMDFLCAGTMTVRTKTCGRSGCRCAEDPNARHGPYYEWSRYKDGRLVHRTVSANQAALLVRGIETRKAILELLGRWEEETAEEILGAPKT